MLVPFRKNDYVLVDAESAHHPTDLSLYEELSPVHENAKMPAIKYNNATERKSKSARALNSILTPSILGLATTEILPARKLGTQSKEAKKKISFTKVNQPSNHVPAATGFRSIIGDRLASISEKAGDKLTTLGEQAVSYFAGDRASAAVEPFVFDSMAPKVLVNDELDYLFNDDVAHDEELADIPKEKEHTDFDSVFSDSSVSHYDDLDCYFDDYYLAPITGEAASQNHHEELAATPLEEAKEQENDEFDHFFNVDIAHSQGEDIASLSNHEELTEIPQEDEGQEQLQESESIYETPSTGYNLRPRQRKRNACSDIIGSEIRPKAYYTQPHILLLMLLME